MSRRNHATPQYPPFHVRYTHQSMPTEITLSVDLKVLVPTVGGIHQEVVITYYTTIIVTANNFDLLTLILEPI